CWLFVGKPTTDYQLPITNYQLPTTNNKQQTTNNHHLVKSSAAIQVSNALAGEKSISRLRPIAHSAKRRGRRLRRQWSRTERASGSGVYLLIFTTQLANSLGRRTRLQAFKASLAAMGVKSLILRTHRDKSLG
ncbi:MAG TPA: hypothetical protein DC064_07255, partial [Cyanobacteria bacterium UBA9273]|nr:hypothetical protein [Cyanobacteria bacterium UBA9273]